MTPPSIEQPETRSQNIDILISGGFVLTMDSQSTTYYPGSVAIVKNKIIDVGLSTVIDNLYPALQVIEANDKVIMPGLVNTHGHASNSLIRGLGRDLPLHMWLENVCWPIMNNAEDEDLFNGVLLSCLEMLLNGITTFTDMWTNVDVSVQAVETSGQRAMLAHNIKDFGDPDRGVRELATAMDAWRCWNGHADGKIQIGLGPHCVYTCQPSLLAACAELAEAHSIPVQIHVSETTREVEMCRSEHGCSPVELIADLGLLKPQTILAHAVHLDDTDIKLVKESEAAVAHNIASNLILASGIAPIRRYLAEGICVGLGTDGPGSNDGLDLFRDLKLAALTQKGINTDPTSLPAETALQVITVNGAVSLGIADRTGSLEAGKSADIILLDFDKPHLTPRHYDSPQQIMSLLVYCASGSDIDTVFVDGKILVSQQKPLYLDPVAIQEAAQRSSEKVKHAASFTQFAYSPLGTNDRACPRDIRSGTRIRSTYGRGPLHSAGTC